MSYIFHKKKMGTEINWVYIIREIHVDHRGRGGHLEILLIDF